MPSTTQHLFHILQGEAHETLRLLRGPYSQIELAKALDITPSAVADWETGTNAPQPRHVRGLLLHAHAWTRELGMRLTELLELAVTTHKKGDV